MSLPELCVQVVDLSERSLQIVLEPPTGVVPAKKVQIRDPPAMIASTRAVDELAGQLSADDPFAETYRLEDAAAVFAPATNVVDSSSPRRTVELSECPNEVGAVDVVPHLLAGVTEDRIRLSSDRAAHEIGQEAM